MSRIYFRVERERSLDNANLLPTGQFMRASGKRYQAEELLEQRRQAGKPKRPSAFYIFEDEDWPKALAKGKVKSPERAPVSSESDWRILHRGDNESSLMQSRGGDPDQRNQLSMITGAA